MSIFSRFCTVGGLTIVSRVFGVIRESMLSHFLGACSEMDAFLIAFKFPSFFRKCFAEGGFHSVFVPYFIDFAANKKHKGSLYFSSRILTLLFWAMLIFSIIVFIFAETFVTIMAPGFINSPEKFNLAVEFTRIIFPNVGFVALSTIYSGILIANNRFFPFAFAPILVNIILISSLVIGSDLASAGYRISYGVLLSGIFQFVFLYFYTKSLRLPTPNLAKLKISRKMKEFLKKLAPVIVGAGVAQFNVFVDSLFGSFLATGSISFIYFADRFIQLPLALFGISMATVLLPEISTAVSKQRGLKPGNLQDNILTFTVRLAIPSVVALIVLSHGLVSTLYGHGKFSTSNVNSTSAILQIFALGLPAYIMSKIFASILFAQKNTRTPVIAAIISIICNIVLNCILIIPLGIIGVAISTSISGVVNACILYRKSKNWFSFDKKAFIAIVKILIASLAMGMSMKFMTSHGTEISSEIKYLIVNALIGTIVYLIMLVFLKDETTVKLINKYMSRTK